MTDEQIHQDANAREAADRADNARKDAQAWQATENAANRAHQLAMQDAEARHCEAMARITVDSGSGSGHPLGVVGRGLEALGITPHDVGALLRKRVDPETPFDRMFGALVEAATPIALAYSEKMMQRIKTDEPPDLAGFRATGLDGWGGRFALSSKQAIPAMLGALAALGYGGAGGDAEDAEDEFAEYIGKPRAEWTGEDAATMFRVLMEWLEPDEDEATPEDADTAAAPIDPADFANLADVAEYARRTLAGEDGVQVAADIVNRWAKPADVDGAE